MTTRVAIAIGLILYVVLTTGVSFFWMARVRKPADYLVAGRGLPIWVLIGTIIGTCIGTGVIIGGSGLAYQHGWAGCAYPIGLGLGTLLTGLFFARMRRYRFMTLSEEIACYYDGNRGVVEFSNITLFLSQLCWLTVQIMGGAAVLGAVIGLPYKVCVVLAGLAKAVISIPGGLKAVVYTDVLQTFVLFSGFGFLMWSALADTGGLAGLRQVVPPDYFSFLGVASLGGWSVLSLILVLTLNPIADPGRRLTIYSARTESGARSSMVASGVTVIAFSVVIGITGMYTYRLNPHLPVPDQALPWLVMNVLPPWLAAFVVVAAVAGMSSAANGNAAAAGTFFVRHIYPLATGKYPKRPVVVARWALACAFLASTALALYTKSIVGFVVRFLPLTMSGLAVIILLGRFWKCATWQGALSALVITPAVSLALMFLPAAAMFRENPIIPATLVGLLAHIVVSQLTPASRRTFEQVAKELEHERQAIEGPSPEKLPVPDYQSRI
ncbi:MAG TPA: sodium:solute symporter family protein [Candidatus Acidoferrum sp.]|jgi:SSS family solute:Na+ symporter|nr:sodium:solute symporter family protein [Candidatus Acidoferrum sp.]